MTATEIADLAGTLTGDRPTVFAPAAAATTDATRDGDPTPRQVALLTELHRCPASLLDLPAPASDARTLTVMGYIEHDRRTDLVTVTLAGRAYLAARRRREGTCR